MKTCQKQGKTLTLSIGGADGHITFTSAEQAKTFGEMIYNTFLAGSTSSKRPFGSAVLDGYVVTVIVCQSYSFDSISDQNRP